MRRLDINRSLVVVTIATAFSLQFFSTSQALEEMIVHPKDEFQPGQKWYFPAVGIISSKPTIAGDLIYFGTRNGYLHAVDTNTGKEKWRFQTGGDIQSSPAIDKGIVYFGSEDNYLYALSVQTGKEVWKYGTKGAVESTPLVYHGFLFFTSIDGHLYSLESKTGKLNWKFKTGGEVSSSPIVAAGLCFFGSRDGHFYAVDAKTGKECWKFKTVGPIDLSPIVKDSSVIVAARDGTVYALEHKTGQKKWDLEINRPTGGELVVGGNLLFILGRETVTNNTPIGSAIYAVDIASGRIRWDNSSQRVSPAADNGVLYYFSCTQGGEWSVTQLCAIEIDTRRHLRKLDGSGCYIVVSGDVVFVASCGSFLHAIEKSALMK